MDALSYQDLCELANDSPEQALAALGQAVVSADERHEVERLARAAVLSTALSEALQPLDPAERRLFAADCAEHVLSLWNERFPDDRRPAEAIDAARRYARGELGEAALARAHEEALRAGADVFRQDFPPGAPPQPPPSLSLTAVAYAAAYAADGPDVDSDVMAVKVAWYAVGAWPAHSPGAAARRLAERSWQVERLRSY